MEHIFFELNYEQLSLLLCLNFSLFCFCLFINLFSLFIVVLPIVIISYFPLNNIDLLSWCLLLLFHYTNRYRLHIYQRIDYNFTRIQSRKHFEVTAFINLKLAAQFKQGNSFQKVQAQITDLC